MNHMLYSLSARIHTSIALAAAPSARANRISMLTGLVLGILLLIMAPDVFASGNMPWEGTICKVAKSLSGTTAKAVALIAVVVSGLMLAFMEVGGVFKMAMGLLCGLSMALLASQWVGFISGDSNFAC